MIIILWIVLCVMYAKAKRIYNTDTAIFQVERVFSAKNSLLDDTIRLFATKFSMIISLAGFALAAFLTYKFGTRWFYIAYSILFVATRLYTQSTMGNGIDIYAYVMMRRAHMVLTFYSIYLWIALIVIKAWFQW